MREAGKYQVYSGGAVEAGFEVNDVVAGFATLFKVSQDQAVVYVTNKKLIRKDLSESEASIYREKINAIGLIALVAGGNAANDEVVPVVPETTDSPPSNGINTLPAEPSVPQLVCPKCSLMQPRSEECTKCGLIFSKYRDPNYRPKPEPQDSDSSNEELVDHEAGSEKFSGLIKKHTPALLVLIVVAIGAVSTALLPKSNTEMSSAASGPAFTQKSQASAKVEKLMIAADLNNLFDGLGENLEQLFSEQLSSLVKERGGSQESTLFIMDMLPKAFNEAAGTVGLANWLQITLKDSDLDTLIDLYNVYVVREATELAKNLQQGSALHETFLASYANNPPGPRRRQTLEQLVDVTAMDQLFMMVWVEAQTSMITLAAATAPDSTSKAGAQRTGQAIRDMRDMVPFAQGPIREEAIKNLAWQLESYDLMELQALVRALDTPEARELYTELRRGIETYLEDATAWLSALTAQQAVKSG